MNTQIDLSGLKDLHLMNKPNFWPLAIGWWIVIVGLIFFALLAWKLYSIWRDSPPVYACRKAKKILHQQTEDIILLKKLSQLLKRVAIAADGRPQIAPLSDKKWQEYLTSRISEALTDQEAHLIAFAPYETSIEEPLNRDILLQHTILWIKKIFKNKKSS